MSYLATKANENYFKLEVAKKIFNINFDYSIKDLFYLYSIKIKLNSH